MGGRKGAVRKTAADREAEVMRLREALRAVTELVMPGELPEANVYEIAAAYGRMFQQAQIIAEAALGDRQEQASA